MMGGRWSSLNRRTGSNRSTFSAKYWKGQVAYRSNAVGEKLRSAAAGSCAPTIPSNGPSSGDSRSMIFRVARPCSKRGRSRPIASSIGDASWPCNRQPKAKSSAGRDRKSTRLNSSHVRISYAVFCLKKKKTNIKQNQTKNKKKDKYSTYR